MRWLLHGNLTAAVGEALRRHGHTATEAGVLLAETPQAGDLLELAEKKQLDVMTDDGDLATSPFESPIGPFHRSIVLLQLAGGDVEQDDAVDRLFKRYKRLTPGRLYTVTATRVKVRQLPTLR